MIKLIIISILTLISLVITFRMIWWLTHNKLDKIKKEAEFNNNPAVSDLIIKVLTLRTETFIICFIDVFWILGLLSEIAKRVVS